MHAELIWNEYPHIYNLFCNTYQVKQITDAQWGWIDGQVCDEKFNKLFMS